MRELWIRLGVSLEITEAEESAIFCGDNADIEAALAKIIADGRARLDGDSYIEPFPKKWTEKLIKKQNKNKAKMSKVD